MNDLSFLFFLIPGLIMAISAITMWLVFRQFRKMRRDLFGEAGGPVFATLFPTSKAGMRYYSGQGGTGGFQDEGGQDPYHSPGSWDHGSAHHDHGSSHGYSSGYDYCGDSSSSSGSSCDSGSSSSSSSDSSSSSSSSDSGSSSW